MQKTLRYAVIVIALTVTGCLLLECSARLFLWVMDHHFIGDYFFRPHRFLGYALKPNIMINGPNHLSPMSKKISINSSGFRGREFSANKGDNTYRIFCLGESSTFCISSSDDEHTWPSLLESMLAKEYPQYTMEVINAGVPSWTTYESMINFAIKILDYSPDMIIVYHGANDIAYYYRATQAFNYSDKPPVSLHSRLASNSAAYTMLMSKWKIFASRGRLPDTFGAYGPKAFKRNLQNIISMAIEHKVKVVLSTQATLIKENPNETLWKEVSAEYLAWFGLNQKALLRAYKEINGILKELSTENHAIFVDNAEEVPSTFEYLLDYAHLWDKGCEVVAKNFFEAIKKEGLIMQKI